MPEAPGPTTWMPAADARRRGCLDRRSGRRWCCPGPLRGRCPCRRPRSGPRPPARCRSRLPATRLPRRRAGDLEVDHPVARDRRCRRRRSCRRWCCPGRCRCRRRPGRWGPRFRARAGCRSGCPRRRCPRPSGPRICTPTEPLPETRLRSPGPGPPMVLSPRRSIEDADRGVGDATVPGGVEADGVAEDEVAGGQAPSISRPRPLPEMTLPRRGRPPADGVARGVADRHADLEVAEGAVGGSGADGVAEDRVRRRGGVEITPKTFPPIRLPWTCSAEASFWMQTPTPLPGAWPTEPSGCPARHCRRRRWRSARRRWRWRRSMLPGPGSRRRRCCDGRRTRSTTPLPLPPSAMLRRRSVPMALPMTRLPHRPLADEVDAGAVARRR